MDFTSKLQAAWTKNNSLLSVGLDPDMSKLPKSMLPNDYPLYAFNKSIIDATFDLVCCFKLNTAFYEGLGSEGVLQLKKTMEYLQEKYADIPTIVDAKRADIDNTNNGSATYVFDYLAADAITINPYLGVEANQPFLERADKGIFVLCRTSNKGAGEFQDLMIDDKPLYQHVAAHVRDTWNHQGNCHLVVGATYPEEAKLIRDQIDSSMVLLLPGLGAQGGNAKEAVKGALNTNNEGVIINASRAVLYASNADDFAESARTKAQELKDEINTYRSA